jgi:hypothetical protein
MIRRLACAVALCAVVAGCGSSTPAQPKATGWTSAQKALFYKTCSGPKGINRLFKSECRCL